MGGIMKILLALNDREDAKIFAHRFISAISSKNYSLKIAAYNKSTTYGMPIDYNLESLKYIYNAKFRSFTGTPLETYYNQIKHFNPDIIISDMELYTSHIAKLLNIKIWQVSPLLLHYSTPLAAKAQIGFFAQYQYFFLLGFELSEIIRNCIYNADKRFVYSHFGDANVFNIEKNFEWVRPYHNIGKVSLPCSHNIVSAVYHNDKKLINYMKQYKDGVLFSIFTDENYYDISIKNIYDADEYFCNIKNSHFILSQGYSSFLADAFYNEKHVLLLPNYMEHECTQNSLYSAYFGTGTICNEDMHLESIAPKKVVYDNNIKFLHEHLENL